MNSDKKDFPENKNTGNNVLQLAAVVLNKPSDKIALDAPLFSTKAGFDSFALVEFVLRLESNFGIQIPDQDLDPDIFYSVSTIAVYIDSRITQRT